MRVKKLAQDINKVIESYDFERFINSRLPKENIQLSPRSFVKNSPGLHMLLVIDGPNPVELDHYTRILGHVLKKLGGVINERILLGKKEKKFNVINFPGSEHLRCYKMKEFTHRRILDVGCLLHENIDIFLDYAQINVPIGGTVHIRRDSWFSFIAECKGIEVYKAYKQLELPKQVMNEETKQLEGETDATSSSQHTTSNAKKRNDP